RAKRIRSSSDLWRNICRVYALGGGFAPGRPGRGPARAATHGQTSGRRRGQTRDTSIRIPSRRPDFDSNRWRRLQVRKAKFGARRLVLLVLVAMGAVLVAFVVLHPKTDYGQGVSNAKIDSQ